ncbi:MAG TPA: acylneuraminate cytidylyltransferase family protein [Chryseosolibacter sp.]
MSTLFIIPARGGSKGLPGKNIKELSGKPLLEYSIDIARACTTDDHICLSTDSEEIIKVARDYGLNVPFNRPAELASDTAGTREVILHALDHYKNKGMDYDRLVLLQPTSPFRRKQDILEMQHLFSPALDLVVSVKEADKNPYFSLFEENGEGYLTLSKPSQFTRRQDSPKVYAYNGSVYVINAQSIRNSNFNQFTKIRKYVMDEIRSIDIDTEFDWLIAKTIIENGLHKHEVPTK